MTRGTKVVLQFKKRVLYDSRNVSTERNKEFRVDNDKEIEVSVV